VYGDQTDSPVSETSKTAPISPYGIDKLSVEQHAAIASQVYHIPTVGLRFFNVFGPRQNPSSSYSGVISIFCRRLKEKLPLDIYGDGEQVRDFIFIDDVVAALIKALSSQANEPKVYNICTGHPSSINTLAKESASLIQSPLQIRYLPPRKEDIRISIGDPSKAQKELGFRAEYSLTQGLSKMLMD